MTMSLFVVIAHISRPSDSHLVRDGEALEFHRIGDGPLAQIEPGLAVYRVNGLLMFANCGQMKSRVTELIKTSVVEVRALILDLGMSSSIDLTALTIIEELHGELSKRGVRLMAVELNSEVRELFRRAGTDKKLGEENIQADVASAVSAFHREVPKSPNNN